MVDCQYEIKKSNLHKFINILMIIILCVTCFSAGANLQKYTGQKVYYDWLSKIADQKKQVPDRISSDQIFVDNEKVTIKGNFTWAEFTNTDSMLPLLDYGSNGIEMIVDKDTELFIGDVVAYQSEGVEGMIVHRIIDSKNDTYGEYYITKGDNLRYPDPIRVRKIDIKRVLVGVIW